MAIALKAELHRIVETIPESQPDVANALIELMQVLVVASHEDESLFHRLVGEIDDIQASSKDPRELLSRFKELRKRATPELRVADPLLSLLENAPDDDEPLPPEEVAILDARHASAAGGATISDDELSRRLAR